jgi:hypothetical protein
MSLLRPSSQHRREPFMNRSPFFVAQSPNYLSLDNMFTNSPFSFVVSRFNPRVNDKREPILKAIANLADKLSDLLICVLTPRLSV